MSLRRFLRRVDLRRRKDGSAELPRELSEAHPGEEVAVRARAAGKFFEDTAAVSSSRLAESLSFPRIFKIGEIGADTALRYARIVVSLRESSSLSGRSKLDRWIAAWGAEHSAPLATGILKHFDGIPGLEAVGC